MKKQDVINLYGGNRSLTARSIGISRQALYQWPDELSIEQQDRVVGSCLRLGTRMDQLIAGAPYDLYSYCTAME